MNVHFWLLWLQLVRLVDPALRCSPFPRAPTSSPLRAPSQGTVVNLSQSVGERLLLIIRKTPELGRVMDSKWRAWVGSGRWAVGGGHKEEEEEEEEEERDMTPSQVLTFGCPRARVLHRRLTALARETTEWQNNLTNRIRRGPVELPMPPALQRPFADGATSPLLSERWCSMRLQHAALSAVPPWTRSPISVYLQGGKKKAEWAGTIIFYVLSSSLYSQDTLGARQRHLTARRLNAEAKIIESHTQKKHRLIIVAPNTSHTHTHTLGLQDHPWELTWPCPLPLSAGVCPEQTGPLSVGNRGGLRPCCLAGAEGAAGCQWSVAAGASGNGVTLALTPPPPSSSHQPASGFKARVQRSRKERHSYGRAAGLAVADELTLDGVQRRGEPEPPDVWAVSVKSPHRAQRQKQHCLHKNKAWRLSEVQPRPEWWQGEEVHLHWTETGCFAAGPKKEQGRQRWSGWTGNGKKAPKLKRGQEGSGESSRLKLVLSQL